MIDVTQLKTCAAAFEVEVDDLLAQRLDIYARLLVEWNEKMNLTAITEPNAIVIKHFVDSLTVSRYLPEGPVALVDVGTGAGFPGVPLALYRDDIQLTLLDSLNKRLLFLKEVCTALGLPATLVHARAEEAGRQPAYRERFDVATARAVAALPTLCEYCLPLVKPHGRFIAMKGPDGDQEGRKAREAIRLLGGELVQTVSLSLPAPTGEEREERRLLMIDKTHPTPTKYPRPSAKIAKQPL